MSVTEIAAALNKNKHSVGRYMDILHAAGEVEVRNYGMAKVFSLAQRVPLSAILRYTSEFMMVLDKDFRVLQINAPFLEFLHKAREDVIGRHIAYIPLPDVPLQDLIQKLRDALEQKKSSEDLFLQNEGEHFFRARILETVFEDGREGYTVILSDLTEQKRAELELQRSEARYRAVVEGQTEYICRFLPDGTNVFVNEAYCRFLGMPRERIIGRKVRPRVPDAEAAGVRQHLSSLTIDRPVGTIQHRVILPDGSMGWQQWTDMAIFDEMGNIVEYQSVGRDITEMKQAEEALRQSEEKYRELVELANTVILKMDLSGNITFFNEFAEGFFGYAEDEILGRNVVGTIVPATESSGRDMQELIANICSHTEQYQLHENENITRDGRRVWMRWTNRMIRDGAGKPTGILSIGVDITELKRVEEKLKASEKRFRELAEMLPLPVFETDRACMLTYGNEQAFLSFGYHPEDIREAPHLLEMIAPADRDRARKHIERLLENVGRANEQFTALRKDGTTFPMMAYTASIVEGGRIAGLRGIVIDLTEHNRTKNSLQDERDFIAAVLDTVDALVVVLDPQGRIVRFNRACAELTGYAPEEVQGELFFDRFILPGEMDAVRATFDHLVARRTKVRARNHWVMRDGSRRLIDWSSTALLDREGRVMHVIGTGIDITGREGGGAGSRSPCWG
ncbi:MAG: PAS domain S-box protein [Methanomicrobiales archaeon]|nr:PAS domain S-box protein [Methanomicrobiales archaeon]MDI6876395.1 PAS domain S-box protein [Methanomicrobiales archaeon]